MPVLQSEQSFFTSNCCALRIRCLLLIADFDRLVERGSPLMDLDQKRGQCVTRSVRYAA